MKVILKKKVNIISHPPSIAYEKGDRYVILMATSEVEKKVIETFKYAILLGPEFELDEKTYADGKEIFDDMQKDEVIEIIQ